MIKWSFVASLFFGLSVVASANEFSTKNEFIEFCSTKQSAEFCECAANEKFDFVYDTEVNRRKKVMDESDKNLSKALQWAKNADPSINEKKIKRYCPIKQAYHKDIEAYAMDKFGSKKILRRTMEVKADLETIRQKHALKMDELHDEFGTNEVTRQNFNQMKIPYCSSFIHYQNDKEHFERSGDLDYELKVLVPFNSIVGSVIKDRKSQCRILFKR